MATPEESLKEEELQLVIFSLAQEEYGLSITKVQEINRLVPITKLPQTPAYMEGIINLRGRILPVLDLRKRFALQQRDYTDDTRIIIVEVAGQTLGMIVDSVNEVVRLSTKDLEAPPPSTVLEEKYIEAVGKLDQRLIILLNLDSILPEQQ